MANARSSFDQRMAVTNPRRNETSGCPFSNDTNLTSSCLAPNLSNRVAPFTYISAMDSVGVITKRPLVRIVFDYPQSSTTVVIVISNISTG